RLTCNVELYRAEIGRSFTRCVSISLLVPQSQLSKTRRTRRLVFGCDLIAEDEAFGKIKPFDRKTGNLKVVIDTPKGSRNKYAFDFDVGGTGSKACCRKAP